MRKFLLASVIVFLTNICFAQITMDSVKVFGGTSGFDSVYIKYTTFIPKISGFSYITYNDGCLTTPAVLSFVGCSTAVSVQKDTTIVFHPLGPISSRFLKLYTVWDTSTVCSSPSIPTATDSYFYNVCFSTGIKETDMLENKLVLYPNPAQELFHVQLDEGIILNRVDLLDLQGKLVRSYVNQNSKFELNSIANGIYYVKILTSGGLVVKKIVVRK